MRDAGCSRFIVHARKAVLGGLSPPENREVPPLRFDVVQRLKQDFPQLSIVVNGGLRTALHAARRSTGADGVMLGREAYHRPHCWPSCSSSLCRRWLALPRRRRAAGAHGCYAEREVAAGERLAAITRHMLGLCSGRPVRAAIGNGCRSAAPCGRPRRGAAVGRAH